MLAGLWGGVIETLLLAGRFVCWVVDVLSGWRALQGVREGTLGVFARGVRRGTLLLVGSLCRSPYVGGVVGWRY